MIKQFIFLLALINVGLFSFFNADLILPNAGLVVTNEMSPEKIKILSPQQIQAMPKKTNDLAISAPYAKDNTVNITSSTNPIFCYEWGVFSQSRITEAQIASAKIALQPLVITPTSLGPKHFWVYKLPLKSAEAARNKVLELKMLGMTDLFVVQDAPLKNAISFGIFEDEKLANHLLSELKAKDIKDVVKVLRYPDKGYTSLLFKELTAEKISELQNLKTNFPEANLTEVNCH